MWALIRLGVRGDSRKTRPDDRIENTPKNLQPSPSTERSRIFPEPESIFVLDGVPADHGDKRVEREANHEEDFGD